MHLSPLVAWAAVRSKAVVLLLLTFCLLLLPLWESVIVLYFVVCYFMSVLVLQSSWWGRESWLLCLICLPGVSWWLSGSSSRCHRVVYSLWLWYFLIILIYYLRIGSVSVINHLFPNGFCDLKCNDKTRLFETKLILCKCLYWVVINPLYTGTP